MSAISRHGSCSATATSCTLSAVSTNDLIVIFAFASGSNTVPTSPGTNTAVTTIQTGAGGTPAAARVECRLASSGADTGSGAFTGATAVAAVSYTGTRFSSSANCLTQIVTKNASGNAKASTTASYTTTGAFSGVSGTSWLLAFSGGTGSSHCVPTSPQTLTAFSTTGTVSGKDSNATFTSWATETCTVTSEAWITFTAEVQAQEAFSATVNDAPSSGGPGVTRETSSRIYTAVRSFSDSFTPTAEKSSSIYTAVRVGLESLINSEFSARALVMARNTAEQKVKFEFVSAVKSSGFVWTLVSHTGNATAPNGGNSTPDIDTTGADLLLAHVADYSIVSFTALTDNKSNTWNPLKSKTAGGQSRSRWYYATGSGLSVGSGHHLIATSSGGYPAIEFLAFSSGGAGIIIPEMENGAGNPSASTLATGSITPTVNGSLIVSGLSNTDAGTVSINAGFTITDQTPYGAGNNFGGAAAYLIQGTAGAVNPTWTMSGSWDVVATIASFKALASGTYFGEVNSSTGALTYTPTMTAPTVAGLWWPDITYTCPGSGSQTLEELGAWLNTDGFNVGTYAIVGIWDSTGTTLIAQTAPMLLEDGATQRWYSDRNLGSVTLTGGTTYIIGHATGGSFGTHIFWANDRGRSQTSNAYINDYTPDGGGSGALPAPLPTPSGFSQYYQGVRAMVSTPGGGGGGGTNYPRSLFEAMGGSESGDRLFTGARATVDSAISSDFAARLLSAARTVNETFTPFDYTNRLFGAFRSPFEGGSVTAEAPARLITLGRSTADSTAASEVSTRSQGLARTSAERAYTNDFSIRGFQISRSGSETFYAYESSARVSTIARAPFESLLTSDSVARLASMVRASSDSNISISDIVVRGFQLTRTGSESFVNSNSTARLFGSVRATAESLLPSDVTVRLAAMTRSSADSNNILSDFVVRGFQLSRTGNESFGSSNSTVRLFSAVRAPVDMALNSNAGTRLTVLNRVFADTILIGDISLFGFFFSRSAAEVFISSSNLTARSVGVIRTAVDSTAIQKESITRSGAFGRQAVETSGVFDSLLRNVGFSRGAFDTLVTESDRSANSSGHIITSISENHKFIANPKKTSFSLADRDADFRLDHRVTDFMYAGR